MDATIQKNDVTQIQARLPQDKIISTYNFISPIYDIWGALTETKARNRVIELAQVQNGQNILDVAVGTGLLIEKIAMLNPGGRTTGIDISDGMLAKAQRKVSGYSNVDLKNASASNIPFPDASFDLITNSYMFDLLAVDQMLPVLHEFFRVLKPGGRLILANMTVGEKPGSGIYDKLYSLSPAMMGGCRGVRLSGLVIEAGFTVNVREYSQQFLFPSEIISATKN